MTTARKSVAARKTNRTHVGAMIVLSSCFVISALLKAGDVVAALPESADDGFGNPIAVQQPDQVGKATGAVEEKSESPMTLVAELRAQRDKLKQREAEVEARAQKLKTIEAKLKERLDEIRSARKKLADTAALVDDAAGKDVRRLAQMYQQMKPKQAGQIFNQMAPSFAAGFIAEMQPETAALIMANMEAEKAYAISLLIAGRNMKRNQPGSR